MTAFAWILVACAAVFVLNLIPYFMPPTWAVVAYFQIVYQLPLWPLCIACAVSSTAGRCGLALLSQKWGRRILSEQQRANVSALGGWMNSKPGWRLTVAVMVYSLGPIPSNQLFIAAGLSGTTLSPIAAGFLGGRLLSYPALVAAAGGASDHISKLFKGWTDPKAVVLELASIVAIVVFAKIDWPRLLHLSVPSVKAAATDASRSSPDVGPRV